MTQDTVRDRIIAIIAEQAMLDDLTAARFVRRAREMRRSIRR